MACAPLDDDIKISMKAFIFKVAKPIHVGLLLVLTNLLRWPDWELPDRAADGMRILDFVPPL
eukprot:4178079-Karenia_brevis.AAC.1